MYLHGEEHSESVSARYLCPTTVWQQPLKQTNTTDSSLTMDQSEGTRTSSPALSSHGEHVDDDRGGDYSTRMEELFGGDEEEHPDEEEEFLYDGVDAEQVTGTNYREQLRDVLGPDDTSDVFEEEEVKRSLLKEDPSEKFNIGEQSVSTASDLVLMGVAKGHVGPRADRSRSFKPSPVPSRPARHGCASPGTSACSTPLTQ